mmetsp:Transcript_20121/g.56026  ORF Transcript_20121/g.56026 Transcript_20121/m.56026 type:complete len:96 (+) Transcript_20121:271-558(+)|eukprot:552063-Pelagomonas_calceolata.AAC.1
MSQQPYVLTPLAMQVHHGHSLLRAHVMRQNIQTREQRFSAWLSACRSPEELLGHEQLKDLPAPWHHACGSSRAALVLTSLNQNFGWCGSPGAREL